MANQVMRDLPSASKLHLSYTAGDRNTQVLNSGSSGCKPSTLPLRYLAIPFKACLFIPSKVRSQQQMQDWWQRIVLWIGHSLNHPDYPLKKHQFSWVTKCHLFYTETKIIIQITSPINSLHNINTVLKHKLGCHDGNGCFNLVQQPGKTH